LAPIATAVRAHWSVSTPGGSKLAAGYGREAAPEPTQFCCPPSQPSLKVQTEKWMNIESALSRRCSCSALGAGSGWPRERAAQSARASPRARRMRTTGRPRAIVSEAELRLGCGDGGATIRRKRAKGTAKKT